jgi:hypothetical protein
MFRWYRWEAILIGQESGNITVVNWVRFRKEEDMEAWAKKMNDAERRTTAGKPLTLWGYQPIGLHPQEAP